MPLRDHFRSPLDDVHSWDELHGGWPMMIVQELIEILPSLISPLRACILERSTKSISAPTVGLWRKE